MAMTEIRRKGECSGWKFRIKSPMSKKAIFFTLMSMMFMLVIVAFFMPNSEYYSFMGKVPTLKTRISIANSFMQSIYGELGERALVYSSNSALNSLLEYIDKTGKPLTNLGADFSSVILTATIKGESLEDPKYNILTMRNRTISELMEKFERLANTELNLDANLSINSISLYQSNATGPKRFIVELNLSVYLDAGIAVWNTTQPIVAEMYVDRFDDPYYVLNPKYRNRISFTNISNWTSPSQVFYFIDAQQYTYDPNAPSFLMRFMNLSSGSDCCGMESLVNPVKLNIITNKKLSYVDYCFFSQLDVGNCNPSGNLYNFTHLTNNTPGQKFYAFKLEIYHTDKYNLTNDRS